MRFSQTFAAVVLSCVVGNVLSTASPSSTLGRFSFDYAIAGDGGSRPVHVFDDGQRTYMQFKPGAPVPALLSPDGEKLFMPSVEGPYIVIAAVPRDFVAQLGLSRTRVTHSSSMSNAPQHSPDGRPVPPLVRPVQLASAGPVAVGAIMHAGPAVQSPTSWQENSYARPLRGDDIEWTDGASASSRQQDILFAKGDPALPAVGRDAVAKLAKQLQGAAQVVVVGRDDSSYKEGLAQGRTQTLIDALVRNGVPRNVIVARPSAEVSGDEVKLGRQMFAPSQIRWRDAVRLPAPQAPAPAVVVAAVDVPPVRDWDMRQVDQNVQRMFERWSKDAGWDLVWRDGPPIAITGDVQLGRREFLDATRTVIAQARTLGYRVKATAYSKANAQGRRTLVIEGEQ
ncbi:MAG: TrbG/VirB9 family P-type conjugative transfer protein [Burkholderiales bacterium]|nr:TrbG/VirB9 family P-type conjugative transfer protein [Burkholderiales bacterium]